MTRGKPIPKVQHNQGVLEIHACIIYLPISLLEEFTKAFHIISSIK